MAALPIVISQTATADTKTLSSCPANITVTGSDTTQANCTYHSGISTSNTITISDGGTWEGSVGTVSNGATAEVNISNGSIWNLKSYGYTLSGVANYSHYRPGSRWGTLTINLSDNSLVDSLIAGSSGEAGQDYITGNVNGTININADNHSEFRGNLRNGSNGGVNNFNIMLTDNSVYTGGIALTGDNDIRSTVTINLDNSTFQKGEYSYGGLDDKRRTYLEITNGKLMINANNGSTINHDIYGTGANGSIQITLNDDSQYTGSLISVWSSNVTLALNDTSQADIFNFDYQGSQEITIKDNATLNSYSLQDKANSTTNNPFGKLTNIHYLLGSNSSYLKKYVQALMVTDGSHTAAQTALSALQAQDVVTRAEVNDLLNNYADVLTLGSLVTNLNVSDNGTVDTTNANLVVSNFTASDNSNLIVDSSTYNQLVIMETANGTINLIDTGDQEYLGLDTDDPLIAFLGSTANNNLTVNGQIENGLTAYTAEFEDNSNNSKQTGWYYHANGLSNTAYGIQAIAAASLNASQAHRDTVFSRPESYRLNPADKGAVWVKPFYEKQSIATAQGASARLSGRGVVVGADKELTLNGRNYLVGMAASASNLDLDNQANHGKVKTYAIHAYATHQAENSLFIDAHTQISRNHN